MTRTGKITKVLELKSGVSDDGKKWAFQRVVMEWMEQTPNGDPYRQSLVVTLRGKLKEECARELVERGTEIAVHLSFYVNEYNQKFYNNVTGSIGKQYMEN